jgi:hypothetical protein
VVKESRLLFEELKGRILGQKVSRRELIRDSLVLHLDCESGDGRGLTIWFQPIWHLRGPHHVLFGSLQVPAGCDFERTMSVVADSHSEPLFGRSIEEVAVHPLTFDLTVFLAGGFSVCTFVADVTLEDSWQILDNATGTRLRGSSRGLFVRTNRQMKPGGDQE